MRLLLVLLLPAVGYSQFDTTIVYKTKIVHTLTVIDKCNTDWKIDTIKYQVPFEIKLSKTKLSIDGYGDYPVARTELRGVEQDHDAIRHYAIKGGGSFMFLREMVMLELPIKDGKGLTVIFEK